MDKKRLSEGLIMAALKSTCKHVIHYSHYSLSDVVWTFSNENIFLTLMYQYSRICIRIYVLIEKNKHLLCFFKLTRLSREYLLVIHMNLI